MAIVGVGKGIFLSQQGSLFEMALIDPTKRKEGFVTDSNQSRTPRARSRSF